jgi:oryzin
MLRALLFLTGLAAVVCADDRPKYVPGRYIVQLKPGADAGAIDAHHEAVRSLARRDRVARHAQANPLEKRDSQCKVVTVTATVTENAPAPSTTSNAYTPGADLDNAVKRTFTVGHGNFHAYVGNFDEQVIKEIEKLPNVVCVEPDEYVYLGDDWPIAGNNPYPVAGGSASHSAGYVQSSSTSRSGSAYPSASGYPGASAYQSGYISTPGSAHSTGSPQPSGKYPTGNDTVSSRPTASAIAASVPLSSNSATSSQPSTNGTIPNTSSNLNTQQNSIWSLGDLSHKHGVDNSTGYTYVYEPSAGEGTTAYVFDTGIRSTHEEFEGRVRFGINALTNSTTGAADGNNDGTGHGTHVAGTLGGKTYGAAKKVALVDVKIFDTGSATMSSILAGLDWAFKDVQTQGTLTTAVFSMSFGARTSSTTLDAAIKALYDFGILTVVAAGNENKKIGNTSPARLAESFTVGYTNQQRQRVDSSSGTMGSNYGPELDVWAPGYEIVSADYLSDTGSRVESGTSMATPLVAGLVCYLRALESGLGSPKAVTDRILALAENGVVGDVKDSKNVLVYNGSGQ